MTTVISHALREHAFFVGQISEKEVGAMDAVPESRSWQQGTIMEKEAHQEPLPERYDIYENNQKQTTKLLRKAVCSS